MNEDSTELLERRMAERVEARVRGRLFKHYAALGSIAIGLIGFFGWNVVTALEDQARSYAETAVAPSVAAAGRAADEARARAVEIAARLDALEDFQNRREAAMFAGEQQVQRNQARVDRLAGEIEQRLEGIRDKIQETQATLADTEAQLAAQSERVREAAGVGSLGELASSLASLSEQVALLDEQLREIRARTEVPGGYETPMADARQIEAIQRVATEQAQVTLGGTSRDGVWTAGAEPPDTAPLPLPVVEIEPAAGAGAGVGPGPVNTVYFQFAGVTREVAQAISRRLAPFGFEVPGEERIKTASGLHEVRYFFEDDAGRAAALAEAVNAILRETGYRAEVEARDVTGFRGQKPRAGTLELWLEPVPAG